MNDFDYKVFAEMLYGIRHEKVSITNLASEIGVSTSRLYGFRYGIRPTKEMYRRVVEVVYKKYAKAIKASMAVLEIDIEQTDYLKSLMNDFEEA